MSVQEEFRLLGYEAEDKVTGMRGVIVSISFDVSGCIQGYMKPKVDKDGKQIDGYWFDTKRLKTISAHPIVDQPEFVSIPGGESLPGFPSLPSK
jgi:hypothetical protein